MFPKYKPVAYVADAGYLSVADNVHNYPLQLASAHRHPRLAAALRRCSAGSLVLLVQAAFSREAGGSTASSTRASGRRALGYIVHLFFGLSVTGRRVFLWFCFGLLLAPTRASRRVKRARAGGRLSPPSLVVVLAAALFVGNVVYIVADNALPQGARRAVRRRRTASACAERAVRLNPYNDMYRAEVGLAYQD